MCGWISPCCATSLGNAAPIGAETGIGWEIVDGPPTNKPASWLILSANGVLGQLTVWVSGEAEMDWGTPSNGGERHYDVTSKDDLSQCIDDLEAALDSCL